MLYAAWCVLLNPAAMLLITSSDRVVDSEKKT